MKINEIKRIAGAISLDRNIDAEIVYEGIEAAITQAALKVFGEDAEVQVSIDRETGEPDASVNGNPLSSDDIGDLLGRIAAQTAKQVMIQKIREAERDALFDEFTAQRGEIISGTITKVEPGGTVLTNLGKTEAILPRSEQIPGETHNVNERVRAVVMDVRKQGSRVKIILSRTHPELVRRLFELEIPEVSEGTIEVRSLSREAGYRSKVAVTCHDPKVDPVGACVGVRGARIRNVVDELAGERIDIIRWNDSLRVLVPNALQPAEVEDVILCPQLGKVIVLVEEDNLSLAIGRKGQNVRLASKLVGWDIQVMTPEKLDAQIAESVAQFTRIPQMDEDLAENLVAQGFFTFDELSIIEPDALQEISGLDPASCDAIVEFADEESARQEAEEKMARERRRQLRAMGMTEDDLKRRTDAARAAEARTGEIPADAAAANAAVGAAVPNDGEADGPAEMPDPEVAEAMAEDAAEAPTAEGEAEAATEREEALEGARMSPPHESAEPLPADEAGEDSATANLTNAPVAVGDDPEAAAAPADAEETALDQTAADEIAPPQSDAPGVDADLAGAAPVDDENAGAAGVTPDQARPSADDAAPSADGVLSVEEETPAGEPV
ncbi:transcription termination factor NusA [Alienimonas sp. DA493]|uniref:transcription termination factor NusA n=1 Tax=Alienimonas sp. DA493 TaxID=3373605 RepID=UPI003754468F